MYKVYGNRKSRAFRVAWILEELGQPYELLAVKPHAPEVRDLNPTGKVPVLVDGDLTVTDSTAIMTYLADKHRGLLAPAGSALRAQQDAMTLRILDELEGPIWNASKHSFILPKDKRVPEVIPANAAEFIYNLNRLGDEMTGDYLVGDEFSLADIVLVHVMSWALFMQIEITHQGLKNYAKRIRSRAAYQTVFEALKAE